MNQYVEYFTNYIRLNYDMNNKLILSKYLHSLRVAKLMLLLGRKLGLNDQNLLLAYKIGLCHDLGRFYEVVRNGKLNNVVFDHAAYSNKILYNDKMISYYDLDDNEHLIMRKAIYYHNKKELTDDLEKKELLFSEMIRDADKLDLLKIRFNGKHLLFNSNPSNEVLNNYFNNQTIDLKNIHNNTDSAILYLSFIKDLSFDYSYDLAMKDNYVDDLLKIIEVDQKMNGLMCKLLEKINERGKEYVRKKI